MVNNTYSLNEFGNVVGCDIIRGAGFNTNSNSTELTYDIIMQDIVSFVNQFLDKWFFVELPEKNKKDYWNKAFNNKLNVIL